MDMGSQRRGRPKNPPPQGIDKPDMTLVWRFTPCLPKDCKFCKADEPHAEHITHLDWVKLHEGDPVRES